jgi:hypothetical protein
MTTPPVDWEQQGCPVCRGQWMRGERPRKVVVDARLHETLYRCDVCHTFWVETERFATAIDDATAEATFGERILHDD